MPILQKKSLHLVTDYNARLNIVSDVMVTVQHKNRSAMISVENRTKHELQNKLKSLILHICKLHKKGQKF